MRAIIRGSETTRISTDQSWKGEGEKEVKGAIIAEITFLEKRNNTVLVQFAY